MTTTEIPKFFFAEGTLLRKRDANFAPVQKPGYYLVLEVRSVDFPPEYRVKLLHEDGNIRYVFYPFDISCYRYERDWERIEI